MITPCKSADCCVIAAAFCSITTARARVLQFPSRKVAEPRQTTGHEAAELESVLCLPPCSTSHMRRIYLCVASGSEAVCTYVVASHGAA